jgi:hypothetical protein
MCDARLAKSGQQGRALMPLQPSTVVDYEGCEIGEQQGGWLRGSRDLHSFRHGSVVGVGAATLGR